MATGFTVEGVCVSVWSLVWSLCRIYALFSLQFPYIRSAEWRVGTILELAAISLDTLITYLTTAWIFCQSKCMFTLKNCLFYADTHTYSFYFISFQYFSEKKSNFQLQFRRLGEKRIKRSWNRSEHKLNGFVLFTFVLFSFLFTSSAPLVRVALPTQFDTSSRIYSTNE